MATVQFYESDGEVKLFESTLVITIIHPKRRLKCSEITKILTGFNFKLQTGWEKMDWGYEAKFSRVRG